MEFILGKLQKILMDFHNRFCFVLHLSVVFDSISVPLLNDKLQIRFVNSLIFSFYSIFLITVLSNSLSLFRFLSICFSIFNSFNTSVDLFIFNVEVKEEVDELVILFLWYLFLNSRRQGWTLTYCALCFTSICFFSFVITVPWPLHY